MKDHLHSIDRNLMNLIICIGEVIIGALLLIDPIGFTSAIFIALGALLAILGITRILAYFRADPELAAQGGGLVSGLVFVLVGIFCIFWRDQFILTFPVLTVVYGVLTLVNGINKLQWAVDGLRLHRKYWYISMICTVLTLVFGALILLNPFTATTALWTFIALSLIAEAVLDILSLVFGKQQKDPT